MSLPAEYHGDSTLVRGSNNFLVADGAARLDGCTGPSLGRLNKSVREREERVGSYNGVREIQLLTSAPF